MLYHSWITSKVIAHRGLYTEGIPENSLSAFLNAAKNGYTIELDVQITSDGEIVVFHDYNALRMTGHDLEINKTKFEQLKNLRLNGSDEKIPLLKEVFNAVDGKVPVLIETKNEGRAGMLEQKLCSLLMDYRGDYAVMSFNPFSLAAVKKCMPRAARGQISSDFIGEKMPWYEKFILRNMLLNFISKPGFIAYDISGLPNKRVARLRAEGVPVLGWTIRSMEELERAAQYCDNIIFAGIEHCQTVWDEIRRTHFAA